MSLPPLARHDWPGPATGHVFLAHATGFCKEIWNPVVDELRDLTWEGSITAWDAPGHGGSPTREAPFNWWETARAALEVVRTTPVKGPRLGVGHSMGGASLVMAELLAPGTMHGLVLIEPIMFPPPFQRVDENPLAIGATRRRASFGSAREALELFASKAAFGGWDERALRAYVEGGLVERGGRLWLACKPEIEAEAYRAGTAHGAYARLSEVTCPVLILAGEDSHTHPEDFVAHLATLVPDARYCMIPATGHFLPMERPEVVARLIAEASERLSTD